MMLAIFILKDVDVAIAAAVADYRPKIVASQKIKSSVDFIMNLEKTKDILLLLVSKRNQQS
jgi:phosphopantothenoylcysteine decarboxylase/phosphopantothenate--cysteine ligase